MCVCVCVCSYYSSLFHIILCCHHEMGLYIQWVTVVFMGYLRNLVAHLCMSACIGIHFLVLHVFFKTCCWKQNIFWLLLGWKHDLSSKINSPKANCSRSILFPSLHWRLLTTRGTRGGSRMLVRSCCWSSGCSRHPWLLPGWVWCISHNIPHAFCAFNTKHCATASISCSSGSIPIDPMCSIGVISSTRVVVTLLGSHCMPHLDSISILALWADGGRALFLL